MDYPVRNQAEAKTFPLEPGTIILFVDGFRADLAKELVLRLDALRYGVQETPSWAPLPVLLLSGWDRDGNAATAAILCDPEGNGPGHLDHSL